jgi:two-component system phosphate regulon sensor histidine kinase PhoR
VKLGIRLKLFLVSVALIFGSFAVAYGYLTSRVDDEQTMAARVDLLARASLVARDASLFEAPMDDLAAWDGLADALGAASGVRVSLVRVDGAVIGDSEVATAGLTTLENHATRPEIVAALRTGTGSSSRVSATVGHSFLYVAVPFARAREPAKVVGVVRVAEPLERVERGVENVRRLLLVAFLIALAVAVGMSSLAAHWMSRLVRELTDVARRMTTGDLSVRARLAGEDEVGELGRALDRLAGSLASSLGELRSERDLQGRILDGMREGVLVLDGTGRILLMNPALREMLLLATSDVGRLLIESVRHAELHELIEQARGEEGTISDELEIPGIKPRRVLLHATSLAGEQNGVLAVFVDVTDLRRLESLRRDFVANVSHELRTPVTAVRSAAETLRDAALKDPDPKSAERFVDIIVRNSERLQSLIEDLLELSRLESNQFALKKEKVDVAIVTNLVLTLFRERAERKGIRLAAEIAQGLPIVETDQRALEQVVSNLVDNAVKYCPAGSVVRVRGVLAGDGVTISVEDTGPGIAAKHLPRLFERFYRVDAGRSRDVGGTGLGLSIVKHLVEAMGGEVTVRSSVGEGSTFEVKLPLTAPHARAA